METIQRMSALKWVCAILFIILRFGFGSCRILSDEKDQGTSEPNKSRFLAGLEGAWKGIPFLGIKPGGGFLGVGNGKGKDDTVPANGGKGSIVKGTCGGGGWGEGGGRGSGGGGGCNCTSTKNGGHGKGEGSGRNVGSNGSIPSKRSDGVPPVTCRPMNCPNASVSYCEGYGRYLDRSPPYWCKVPWIGTLPFWCKANPKSSEQPLICKPINCAYPGACEGAGDYHGYFHPFWPNSHVIGSQKNEDDRPSEVAASAGHN